MSRLGQRDLQAVAFDVGGTLYVCPELDELVDDQAHVALADARGLSVEEARVALKEQRAKNSELYGDTSKVRALEALGVKREVFQNAAAAIDPSQLLAGAPPVGPVLGELQRRGLRIGVLSNFKMELVRRILTSLAVDWEDVNALVCVDDGLPIKPDPTPFRVLCERLSVEPRKTAFVGDSVSKDLAPAKRLGMVTVLVEGSAVDGDLAAADFRIGSIQSLPDLLK